MTDELRIEYLPLSDLKRHPRNPKDHDIGAISRSVNRFGFTAPVILDERTGYLAAGHGRIDTLAQLKAQGKQPPANVKTDKAGEWLVPVVRGHGFNSDEEVEAYLVADNRITALGGWNEPELAALLQSLADEDEELLRATGYDADDLQALLFDLDPPKPWEPEEIYSDPSGDGVEIEAGYRLASIWYGMTRNNDVRKHMLELPHRNDAHNGATVKMGYSRTNAEETERIIKTYMRPGDRFFEMCCGWMTFSSSAKYFGFSGRGGDIWDVSLEFCKRQLEVMPGDGVVDVIYADCRDTKEPDASYDFVHSNPPFFSLEPYGDSESDLASTGSYERWLDAMAAMGNEAARILKPGALANFVINDFREDGVIVPMHSDFIAAIGRTSGLKLHDLVIAEVISQALRFRKHDYERRRTVKCHEYVITFRKPD